MKKKVLGEEEKQQNISKVKDLWKNKKEMIKMFSLAILNFLEVYGSKVSQWAWHKRWNRGNQRKRYD